MEFKTAVARYKAGTATEAERLWVEEELEKSRLLAELMDDDWDTVSPLPEPPQEELLRMHSKLRIRSIVLVATSLILVAVLLIGAVIGFAPAVQAQQEQQIDQRLEENEAQKAQELAELEASYWNPEESSYNDYVTDLELTLNAYLELSNPNVDSCAIVSTHTGLGTYDLTLYINRHFTSSAWELITYLPATLRENELTLPPELTTHIVDPNLQAASQDPDYAQDPQHMAEHENCKEYFTQRLPDLPDYITVSATVTFPEDLSMEELLAFEERLTSMDERGPTYISWVGVRCSDPDAPFTSYCGMNAFQASGIGSGIAGYPYLRSAETGDSAENMAQHFKSLLRYSQDQVDKDRGILFYGYEDFYAKALEYVEENGVYSYGCTIVTSPQILLELLEDGTIYFLSIEEARINP